MPGRRRVQGSAPGVLHDHDQRDAGAEHPLDVRDHVGDEGGTFGGVASGTVVGPGRAMMGSAAYCMGGAPSWRLTAPTLHNLTNAPGTTIVPSQTTKLVLR